MHVHCVCMVAGDAVNDVNAWCDVAFADWSRNRKNRIGWDKPPGAGASMESGPPTPRGRNGHAVRLRGLSLSLDAKQGVFQ